MPTVVKQTAKPVKPKEATPSNGQSAWDLVDSIRLLLYGESGTGKTMAWATFPGPIRAYICSGGRKPGELRSINTPEFRKKVSPVIISETDQFCEAMMDAPENYATHVLDHGSGLLGLLLKEYLGLTDIPAVRKWGMASQADYGNINEKCIELLRGFLDLPGNTIVICQERIFKGREEVGAASDIIKPTIGGAMTPGVMGWLRPAVDYEVQAFKRPMTRQQVIEVSGVKTSISVREKGVEYCLRCEPHDCYMTKFRVPGAGKLPEVLVLGDSINGIDKKATAYQKLMQVIQGGK